MQKRDWVDGFKVIYPVMVGYVPLGLACGMVLYDAGFSAFEILMMSLFVFAGAAQFMAASMLAMGAAIPSIIVMTFFLNLRHLLMSSSISGRLKNSSIPFLMVFSHTLADEAYAVNYNQFQNHVWSPQKALPANVLAFFTWSISTLLGGVIGSTVTINTMIMNYVLIAMFICMLVNQFASRLIVFVGLFSGILSVVLMVVLQHNIALVIAATIASFVGYFGEEYLAKKKAIEGEWQHGE